MHRVKKTALIIACGVMASGSMSTVAFGVQDVAVQKLSNDTKKVVLSNEEKEARIQGSLSQEEKKTSDENKSDSSTSKKNASVTQEDGSLSEQKKPVDKENTNKNQVDDQRNENLDAETKINLSGGKDKPDSNKKKKIYTIRKGTICSAVCSAAAGGILFAVYRTRKKKKILSS